MAQIEAVVVALEAIGLRVWDSFLVELRLLNQSFKQLGALLIRFLLELVALLCQTVRLRAVVILVAPLDLGRFGLLVALGERKTKTLVTVLAVLVTGLAVKELPALPLVGRAFQVKGSKVGIELEPTLTARAVEVLEVPEVFQQPEWVLPAISLGAL
jgi:hypothetical protein